MQIFRRRRTLCERLGAIPAKAYAFTTNYFYYRRNGHTRRGALDLAARTIS